MKFFKPRPIHRYLEALVVTCSKRHIRISRLNKKWTNFQNVSIKWNKLWKKLNILPAFWICCIFSLMKRMTMSNKASYWHNHQTITFLTTIVTVAQEKLKSPGLCAELITVPKSENILLFKKITKQLTTKL